MRISDCKYTYEVFEKVFTFVANDHGVLWKDIFYSTSKDTRMFTLLCICSILIDKFLRIEFNIKLDDRAIILGYHKNDLVRYYYRFN